MRNRGPLGENVAVGFQYAASTRHEWKINDVSPKHDDVECGL